MDESVRRLSRREFLQAAGLGLGAVAGAGLACGRGGEGSAPTGTPVPSAESTSVSIVASPGPTDTPLSSASPVPTQPSELAADRVLLNGKIITVDSANSVSQAVAIKDSYIQAVGADETIRSLIGPDTNVIELGGRAVTPGLIDAHIHFQVVGLMNGYYVSMVPPDVRTIQDLQAVLAEAVSQKPEGEWVQGYFLVVAEGRLPNKHDLDPVSPHHPVFVLQQGGHYGTANSLALQIAGITADTPDPLGGVIGREASGEPDGIFYNHRAMDVLRQHIPRYTMDMVRQNISSTQPLFASCGVTSFQDNNVRGTDTVATYLDAGRRGEMYLRGSVYYTLEWPGDVDRALNELEYGDGDEFMRFAGFKFLLDGQAKMAYCLAPHNGERWDLPTWDPQVYKDAVRKLHDTGLQICVHCVGDAAVELTLDAFEEAMNANPRPDPRHRIEHGVLTTPEQTRRMKDLGVVVSTQPQFLRTGGDGWVQLFGEERARRAIVTQEWLQAGIPVALGSDAPSTPWYTPLVTLFGAMTRITASNQFYEPDQAMTIQEALWAHTMGSAYAGHEESIKGSIEVGKLADMAVWSQDPYTAPMKEFWQIPIDMTLVGGRVVHPQS